MKTYVARPKDVTRRWFLVDAEGQVLGRLAVRVAHVLRGKHRPIFTTYMDTGDHVVVINAAKISVTGNKLRAKTYQRYSGYPSGRKLTTLRALLERRPTEAVRHAIAGMLPKGPLGRDTLKKLRVYAGPTHRQASQKLEPLPDRMGRG